jgi:integrase
MTEMKDEYIEQCKGSLKATINDDRMLKENQLVLGNYFDYLQHRSPLTLRGYAYRLRELEMYCKKPFKEITKTDIKLFFETKDSRKIRTINGYIANFKAFFRWLHRLPRHNFPECVEWLQKRKPEPSIKSRNDLINKEEFKAILNATSDPEVKCYLTMSFEGIYRKGELRNMRIGDLVVKDKYVLAYSYETKTKTQNLKPMVFAKPYITTWLSAHPYKNDNDAPLFVPMHPTPKKKRVAYAVFNRWLEVLKKATGLTKVLTPHKFRHLRASLMLLSGVDKELVRSLGNWHDNQMLDQVYGHVEKEDKARALLALQGIEETTDEKNTDIKVTKCMICSHPVSELEEYCPNCKNIPTLERGAKEQEKALRHRNKETEELLELKERMLMMEKYIQQKLVDDIVRAVAKRDRN